MKTLKQYLEHRTWRELRATAYAHGLHFNTNHTTLQARERLYQELTGGQLRRSFRALGPGERAALVALQAAGGFLPLYRFTAVFGPIRPYKPWQEDLIREQLAQTIEATLLCRRPLPRLIRLPSGRLSRQPTPRKAHSLLSISAPAMVYPQSAP